MDIFEHLQSWEVSLMVLWALAAWGGLIFLCWDYE